MTSERLALRARRGGLVLLLCVAVLSAFFSSAFDSKLQFGHRDTGRLHYPVKHWIASELRKGHLPEWNPYAGLGTPVLADAIDAELHPFNALFLVLPFDVAFKAWVLLSYLLAALGGFLLARALSSTTPAALLTGLGFALSGFLLSASDNLTFLTPLATAPLVLFAGLRFARGGRSQWLAFTALAAAACAAGGDPVTFAIVLLALPACGAALGREEGQRSKGLRRGLLASLAGLLASAPFVLPTLAWIPASSRATAIEAATATRWNLHPLRLLELLVPYLARPLSPGPSSEVYRVYAGNALSTVPWAGSVYCGAALLALSAIGAARSRVARAFLLCAAVLLWMALGPYAGFGELAAHVPVLRALRYWEKLAGFPALFAALAAALGLDALAKGQAPRPLLRAVASLGALFFAAGAIAWWEEPQLQAFLLRGPDEVVAAGTLALNLSHGLLQSGLSLLALSAVARLQRRRGISPPAVAWAGACVVVLDLALAGAGVPGLLKLDALNPPIPLGGARTELPGLERVVTPFELTARRFPERPAFESIWLWSARTLAPPWNLTAHLGNLEPYVAMPPRRLSEFLRLKRPAERPPLCGLFGVSGLVVPKDPSLAADVGVPPPYTVVRQDEELPAYLVEIPHRPQAYVASRVERTDEDGALAFALDPRSNRSPLSVVEGPVQADHAEGEANIELYRGEVVRLSVRSRGQGLLVLNDAFAPGWTATVDGAPTPILKVNYLVRGVWVKDGSQEVEFRYRTPLFFPGLALAALALALIALSSLHREKAPARQDPARPSRP